MLPMFLWIFDMPPPSYAVHVTFQTTVICRCPLLWVVLVVFVSGSQDPLFGFPEPTVSRRSLVRSCEEDGSDVVGELVSESVGLDEVEDPRRRVSASMSSSETLYRESG